MFQQTHSHVAQAMRSGAVGACAAAFGLWRMSADAQPQAVIDVVINNGKSRAHRA
ncbi:MAG TPA: hypothetical protein VNX47_05790 [Nevskia sp.]|nr:hypothetical protein [Nevskia sp.]